MFLCVKFIFRSILGTKYVLFLNLGSKVKIMLLYLVITDLISYPVIFCVRAKKAQVLTYCEFLAFEL